MKEKNLTLYIELNIITRLRIMHEFILLITFSTPYISLHILSMDYELENWFAAMCLHVALRLLRNLPCFKK